MSVKTVVGRQTEEPISRKSDYNSSKPIKIPIIHIMENCYSYTSQAWKVSS